MIAVRRWGCVDQILSTRKYLFSSKCVVTIRQVVLKLGFLEDETSGSRSKHRKVKRENIKSSTE